VEGQGYEDGGKLRICSIQCGETTYDWDNAVRTGKLYEKLKIESYEMATKTQSIRKKVYSQRP